MCDRSVFSTFPSLVSLAFHVELTRLATLGPSKLLQSVGEFELPHREGRKQMSVTCEGEG